MNNQFKDFVANSQLSSEDKKTWKDLLDNISEDIIVLFEEEIGESEEELAKFNEEVKRQKMHIGNDDTDAILADLEK